MYTEKDAYKTWYGMNDRCSKGYATVCEDWKYYQKFKKWYLSNIYATKQFRLEVDKDLFSKGEKLYSPETCCLLPQSLNVLLASCTSRSRLLPGVTYNSKAGTFKATVSHATRVKAKTFKTEEEAFLFYKTEKEKIIKISAEAYRFLLPNNIYAALMNYKVKPIRSEWKSGYSRNFETYLQ